MMSNGKTPLMLMMALAMPGASHALGLGEIHVDSALNERLAAEIDIVGATPAELSDLRAAVANHETFLRFGADRPGFLASTVFKVTHDSQGRPVISVRSTEAFSEPMVDFLVDLRWHNGELVRRYTLLLDPPGFAEASRLAAARAAEASRTADTARVSDAASAPGTPDAPEVPAAPAGATPLVGSKIQTVARQSDPPGEQPEPTRGERTARKTTHVKVGAKATLRGIAWRVGERSESDLQRMMLAIFRANPGAFDGNINRLHLGAVLTIPSSAELAAISKAEAKHEIHAQMQAWRAAPPRALRAGPTNFAPNPDRTAASLAPTTPTAVVAPPAAAASPAVVASPATAASPTVVASPAVGESLDNRLQSLEHELVEVKGILDSQNQKLVVMREQAQQADRTKHTEKAVAAEAADSDYDPYAAQAAAPAASPEPPVRSSRSHPVPILGGIGLLAAALGAIYVGLRRRASKHKDSPIEGAAQADPRVDEDDTLVGERALTEDDTPQFPRAATLPRDATPAISPFVDANPSITPNAFPAVAAAKPAVLNPVMAKPALADPDDPETQSLYAAIFDEETHPLLPVMPAAGVGNPEQVSSAKISGANAGDATVASGDTVDHLRAEAQLVNVTSVDAVRLDYNLVDLDMTAHHVHMPSALNEQVVMKERRTNLTDVLRMAIEREPDRADLRMKLLELYFSAASTNRNGFLDVVQKFAQERDRMEPDQWDKIAFMGRQIAAENPLFAREEAAGDELADCA